MSMSMMPGAFRARSGMPTADEWPAVVSAGEARSRVRQRDGVVTTGHVEAYTAEIEALRRAGADVLQEAEQRLVQRLTVGMASTAEQDPGAAWWLTLLSRYEAVCDALQGMPAGQLQLFEDVEQPARRSAVTL